MSKRAPIRHHLLAVHPFCVYCGKPLDSSTVTIDHLIPKSKGGTSHAWNIVPACARCNCLKSDGPIPPFVCPMPETWSRGMPGVEQAVALCRTTKPRKVAKGARGRGIGKGCIRGKPVTLIESAMRGWEWWVAKPVHLACPDDRDRSAEFRALVREMAG